MMRLLLLLLLLILSVVLFADDGFVAGADKNLNWENLDKKTSQPSHEEMNKAIDKARAKYRPVLLYFYSKGNESFCREVEENWFKKGQVKTWAAKFVCIKLDSSDKETEELRKNLKVDEGAAMLLFLDCRLGELLRIDTEKGFGDSVERLVDKMKDAIKKNEELAKKLKEVDAVANACENALKQKKMREYVQYLEMLAGLKAKLGIEDSRIDEAAKKIGEMESAARGLLSEAERLISEAEQSFRAHGTRGFRQDLVNQAQQKLNEVSSKYPLSSLSKEIADVMYRLTNLVAEYNRQKQEEENQKKNNP
ncbi:MAG: hypothetical protein N2234_02545 [Planctomycetota bacterium]|nr:hypothetical protein [Planctomycetota bacterium]